jgi:uncharacterized protein with NRDE domain
MAFAPDTDTSLVVAANRDERLDRPALSMTVLAQSGPRILGGRDEAAGGTWLAVNEYGVVAGLTNRPVPDGRDATKRSRGELPLALASHRRASDAVEEFLGRFRPADYNPAWFLIGDRTSLYALDLSSGDHPTTRRLSPGLHILENSPMDEPSAKVDHIRRLIGSGYSGASLLERLPAVLADHTRPEEAVSTTASAAPAQDVPSPPGRRPETLAACVHTADYGTRSSALISVPAATDRVPEVLSADGHPCTSAFVDASALWSR